MFVKYQHIERMGTQEVEGIEVGECYIFSKIDGANASLWREEGTLKAGSRNRELSLENDNAGFFLAMHDHQPAVEFFTNHPNLRLYGEWLCPHSLKTYRQDAWRKFYVFDVCEYHEETGLKYLHYNEYQPLMEKYGIEYIPPLRIVTNCDYDKLISFLDESVNNFLIEDGKGAGEGIVIKRYDFVNRFGRTTWAKIVTSEFKEKHARTMGAPVQKGKDLVEEAYAEAHVTEAVVSKVHANIVNECGWSSKSIPRLLDTVYHDVVVEDVWRFLVKHKYPTINFKTLRSFVYSKVKAIKPELF